MIEILKILAENLVKLISPEAISKAHKRKKLNDIGIEVFLLYSSLNSVLVHGHEILKELERGLVWMKRKVSEGEPERIYYQSITFRLNQQLLLLKQFVEAYNRLRNVLEIIEPELKLNLYPIINGKINAIVLLELAISGRNTPTRLVSINMEKLISITDNDSLNNTDFLKTLRSASNGFEGDEFFNDLIIEEGIKDTDNIRADSFQIIENYLNSGIPRERLALIEKYAKLLREKILQNFSVEELILRVGDKRGSLKEEFIHFM